MRILLVSPLPPPAGGIATWTKAYCEYCGEKGHNVRVVNTALRKARRENKKNLLHELVRTVSILYRLWKGLRTEDYDVVHINSSCSLFGMLRDNCCLLLARKKKTILHCHCNIADQIRNSKFAQKLLCAALKKATTVLVLNENSRAYLAELGYEKAHIIPNFVDRAAVVKERKTNDKIEKVIFVGHVQRTKGFFELLEAAKQCNEIIFQVVGPIYERLDHIDIPSNVCMMGLKTKEEVYALLQEADVFLFPSYSEGFSVALLEAMSAGLPVIATDVGANKDMVENLGGIIIPARNAQVIAEALKELQSFSVRSEMSNWNRQKVQNHYLVDDVMERILELT